MAAKNGVNGQGDTGSGSVGDKGPGGGPPVARARG